MLAVPGHGGRFGKMHPARGSGAVWHSLQLRASRRNICCVDVRAAGTLPVFVALHPTNDLVEGKAFAAPHGIYVFFVNLIAQSDKTVR